MWAIGFVLLLIGTLRTVLLANLRRFARFGLTLLGAWMTTGAFMLLPWVSFSPWRYGKNFTLGMAMEAVLTLADLAEILKLPLFLKTVSSVTALPGWIVIGVMPSLNLIVRLALIGVALVGILSVLFIVLGGLVRSPKVCKGLGIGQALCALASLVLLVGNLNTLDSWGAVGNFPFNLLPVLLGSEISEGAWVAVVGLVVLIFGGLWAVFDVEMMATPSSPKMEEPYGLGTSF